MQEDQPLAERAEFDTQLRQAARTARESVGFLSRVEAKDFDAAFVTTMSGIRDDERSVLRAAQRQLGEDPELAAMVARAEALMAQLETAARPLEQTTGTGDFIEQER